MSGQPPSPREAAGTAPQPDVSILIVVYRTPAFLKRALDSIEASNPGVSYEVIVIDNSPEVQGSREVAQGRGQIQYVPNAKNVGFGRACNQAMRMARGRLYFLLNPDMEVHPGSIEALVECMDSRPEAGIVAPRLHYGDGSLQESCRTFYTLPIFLLRRTFLRRLFPGSGIIREHLMLDWDHEDTREVDWCIGAALLVRRDAVEDVGMMDERFFMYFEDVDWCHRMHQRGWRVVYHPASRMTHHYQRASSGWKPSRGLLIHIGSTLRYYEKWSFVLYLLKRRSDALRNLTLFGSDLLMVAAAFLAAYWLRSLAGGIITDKPLFRLEQYSRFLVFTGFVAAASFILTGLYRERRPPSFVENMIPVARALAWTAMLLMTSTFLFSVRIFSRTVVALFFPMAVLMVTWGRVLLLRAVRSVQQRDLNLKRLGILGPRGAVNTLMERFDRAGSFGYEPVVLTSGEDRLQGPQDWIRRLRLERVQEVLLFEDWQGDAAGLIPVLREEGWPVRMVPAMRSVYPRGGAVTDFMGLPSVAMGVGSAPTVAGSGRRIGDLAAAVIIFALWLVPFLVAAAWRGLRRRPVTRMLRLRGKGGQVLRLRLMAGAGRGRGFLRTVLDWYPGLSALTDGRVSLVGICPLTETEWDSTDEGYRARPPEGPVGMLGPWTSRRKEAAELAAWNRSYPEHWSQAEDLRILTRVILGRG